jgi:hypothetical protein
MESFAWKLQRNLSGEGSWTSAMPDNGGDPRNIVQLPIGAADKITNDELRMTN